jgi:hypothetical protein
MKSIFKLVLVPWVFVVVMATWREKRKRKKGLQCPEANVREKEGNRFCLRKRVFCLSHAKFVGPMNTCIIFEKKKFMSNILLRWIDRRMEIETFVNFRDENQIF